MSDLKKKIEKVIKLIERRNPDKQIVSDAIMEICSIAHEYLQYREQAEKREELWKESLRLEREQEDKERAELLEKILDRCDKIKRLIVLHKAYRDKVEGAIDFAMNKIYILEHTKGRGGLTRPCLVTDLLKMKGALQALKEKP